MLEGFLISIANAIVGIAALAVFFGIMIGIYWMNQNERGDD